MKASMTNSSIHKPAINRRLNMPPQPSLFSLSAPMKTSLLYGASLTEIETGRALIETSTQLTLQAHESLYRGGNYYRIKIDNEVELVLQVNFVEDDGEATEAEFPDATLLLYVDGEEAAVAHFSSCLEKDAGVFRLLRTDGV